MQDKQHIIEEIRDLNRSAAREWLAAFTDGQLRRYLDHLYTTLEPRGRASRWVRDGCIPAIVAMQPEE